MRLQGYFEIPTEWANPIPHGMVKFRIEMDTDPGMEPKMIGSGRVLRTLESGNLLVIGAYNSEQLDTLKGVIPEYFITQEYADLIIIRPELAGTELVDDEIKLIIPKCRFAQ